MNTGIINLILTILVALFLVFGFLWGLIRGLKKTAFRAGWIVATAIICLFLTHAITNLIISIDLSFLGLNYNGQSASTLGGFLELVLTDALGSDVANGMPAALDLITKFPLMICSPFVFVILFWLLKILLWPVWAILARVFFKKQKEEQPTRLETSTLIKTDVTPQNQMFVTSNIQKKQIHAKPKANKHGWYGGLVGIALGLVIACFTFVPVFGVMNIVNSLNNIQVDASLMQSPDDGNTTYAHPLNTTTEEKETVSLLEFALGENIEYVNAINGSIGYNLLRFTGMEAIGSAQFNYLTSSNVEGEPVSLSGEVNSILSMAEDAMYIYSFDFNTATKQDIDKILTTAQNMLTKLEKLNLISVLADDAIPYFCNGILNDPDFPVEIPTQENEYLNTLITKALELGATYNAKSLINNLSAMIDVYKAINDENLIVPLIQQEVDMNNEAEIFNFIAGISDEFADKVSTALFKIDVIEKLFPYCINAGLSEACKQLEIDFTPIEASPTSEIYKNYIQSDLENSIHIIASLDASSEIYLTPETFPYVGKVLDSLHYTYEVEENGSTKEYYIIHPETLDALISKAQTEAKNAIDVDADLNEILYSIIDNISLIDNFETEFTKFGTAYDYMDDYIEPFSNAESCAELKDISLTNLGKSIDIINGTTLANGKVIDLYNYFINNYVADSTVDDIPLTDLAIVMNIPANANISFENEFTAINDLYSQIMELADNSTLDEILDTEIKKLGTNLQIIKAYSLSVPTNQNYLFDIDEILVEILNILKQTNIEEETKDILADLAESIEEFDNKSQIDYSVEFTHLSNLVEKLDEETFTLSQATDLLDEIVNGSADIEATKILNKPIFNAIISHLPLESEFSSNAIKNIISNANTNIIEYNNSTLTINSYKNELNAIIKLMRIIESIDDLNINDTNIDNTIDTLSQDIDYIQKNTVIFDNIKVQTIEYVFKLVINDNTDQDLINILNSAKQDALSNNTRLSVVYDDICSIEDNFSNTNYTINDLKNETTINNINSQLKGIVNTQSFSYITTNAIYTIILNNVNASVQNIDTSNLDATTQAQINQYKANFNTYVTNEINNLANVKDTQVLNDYYKTSMMNIKTELDKLPTIG